MLAHQYVLDALGDKKAAEANSETCWVNVYTRPSPNFKEEIKTLEGLPLGIEVLMPLLRPGMKVVNQQSSNFAVDQRHAPECNIFQTPESRCPTAKTHGEHQRSHTKVWLTKP
jgi:hypothetical protein